MKFSEVAVGQSFKYCDMEYFKVSKSMSNLRHFQQYVEVELITRCLNCESCEIREAPPRHTKEKEPFCSEHNFWIPRIRNLPMNETDLCEEPDKFNCSKFKEKEK